jgi:hypothetical protein
MAIFDRRIKCNLLPSNIQFGGRHRDFRPPHQAKPITDEHSIRRSSSRFSTAESSETCYRRTFNAAVVIAIFDRRIKWDMLPTNIQFGGRHRDLRPPNQAKLITDDYSTPRSSSRVSTSESNETNYRRTFNSAVVIAIFDRRIKRNLLQTNVQFGRLRNDFLPPNQVEPITSSHSIRRSASQLWTAKSSETYHRLLFDSAVVIAIFDRRINRNPLSTNVQFGGRHRDFRPPNHPKPIADERSVRRTAK